MLRISSVFASLVVVAVSLPSVTSAGDASIMEVVLRVTSPSADKVSVSTATDSPVSIRFNEGEQVAFVVTKSRGELEINVIDPVDTGTIIDAGRSELGRSLTLSGYHFDVLGARAISSVREVVPPATE